MRALPVALESGSEDAALQTRGLLALGLENGPLWKKSK